jgi:6-phosphogluconolactonase
MIRYLVSLILTLSAHFAIAQNNTYYMLVGTFTSWKSDGIYVYSFNAQRGITKFVSKISGVENPSYLVVSPNQKFVYCVNQTKGKAGISAFSFDKVKGELKLLNTLPANEGPCYITIDSTGKFIVVAEYGNGSLSVYKTNADGTLQSKVQTIQHDGYGIVYERQDKSHVHSVVFSPDQKYLFAADLGNDRLYQYKFDKSAAEPLTPAETPYYTLPDGSGPRHFVFHPNRKFAYLLNELTGEVVAYSYTNGQLQEIQTIASATEGGKYEKGSADIHITPNAKFLYTSNRGTSNDITVYMITPEGKLNKTGSKAVNDHPRGFNIDPTGKYLLVASRDKNTIQVLGINPNFGLLEEAGQPIDVDMPVFLTMIPAK